MQERNSASPHSSNNAIDSSVMVGYLMNVKLVENVNKIPIVPNDCNALHYFDVLIRTCHLYSSRSFFILKDLP